MFWSNWALTAYLTQLIHNVNQSVAFIVRDEAVQQVEMLISQLFVAIMTQIWSENLLSTLFSHRMSIKIMSMIVSQHSCRLKSGSCYTNLYHLILHANLNKNRIKICQVIEKTEKDRSSLPFFSFFSYRINFFTLLTSSLFDKRQNMLMRFWSTAILIFFLCCWKSRILRLR